MFSAEYFQEVVGSFDPNNELDGHWRRFAEDYDFQGLLVVAVSPVTDDFEVTSAYNLPAAPFNGSDKVFLLDVLRDCFQKHPKPHIHAIKNFALSQLVRKHSRAEAGIMRMWFVPLSFEGNYYVFLGFPKLDSELSIPADFHRKLANILFTSAAVRSHQQLSQRLRTMEIFVREVGHDFASSVQASIATLRAITQGRIRGESIAKKARSVEEEIMSAYRIAEGLGIAADPNYQLREPDDYDLVDVLNDVIEHHRAEAEERGNFIKLENSLRTVPMWGDRTAIEVALGHLLINAIKYSFDGAYVILRLEKDASQVIISIINSGLELPKGDEAHHIWDFGYRGTEARERHVNGSGIGLYTVRKIVARHNGTVRAHPSKQATRFEIRLPTDRFQSKLNL